MVNKILLAEDNTHDLQLTLYALERCGISYEVEVVRDGQQALDYLYRRGKYQGTPESTPSLFLFDVKMPLVDGLELLRILREDELYADIPAIILSNSSVELDIQTAHLLGAHAFITKPVLLHEFAQAVCSAITTELKVRPHCLSTHRA